MPNQVDISYQPPNEPECRVDGEVVSMAEAIAASRLIDIEVQRRLMPTMDRFVAGNEMQGMTFAEAVAWLQARGEPGRVSIEPRMEPLLDY
jgi:hypothetical protein